MKSYLLPFVVVSILFFSCSTDEKNQINDDPESAIIGSWRAIEFQAKDPNNSTLNFGAEILANLVAEECYILKFSFNEDLTVLAKNAVNYISPDNTINGDSIECPTEKDTESSTYSYDGSILNIIEQNGVSQTIKVTIEDDVMSVDATDLDINNLNSEGTLIFEKH